MTRTFLPQVIRDEIAAPGDFEALHEAAVAYAEDTFRAKGRVPPTWVIQHGHHRGFVVTDWESDGEKKFAAYAMRRLMRETGVEAYSFAVEAWTATTPGLDPEETKKLMAFADEHGVSALPKEKRDEVLMVMTHAPGRMIGMTRFLVTPRPRGPNLLGPRIDEGPSDRWGGRMASLLDPEDET